MSSTRLDSAGSVTLMTYSSDIGLHEQANAFRFATDATTGERGEAWANGRIDLVAR